MDKEIQIWKKQEKRIVRLLYRKGLLSDFKLSELYWEEYHRLRSRKKKHSRKYKNSVYAPEVHYSTTDYWGECDEHSVVGHVKEKLFRSTESIFIEGECRIERNVKKCICKTIHKPNRYN